MEDWIVVLLLLLHSTFLGWMQAFDHSHKVLLGATCSVSAAFAGMAWSVVPDGKLDPGKHWQEHWHLVNFRYILVTQVIFSALLGTACLSMPSTMIREPVTANRFFKRAYHSLTFRVLVFGAVLAFQICCQFALASMAVLESPKLHWSIRAIEVLDGFLLAETSLLVLCVFFREPEDKIEYDVFQCFLYGGFKLTKMGAVSAPTAGSYLRHKVDMSGRAGARILVRGIKAAGISTSATCFALRERCRFNLPQKLRTL